MSHVQYADGSLTSRHSLLSKHHYSPPTSEASLPTTHLAHWKRKLAARQGQTEGRLLHLRPGLGRNGPDRGAAREMGMRSASEMRCVWRARWDACGERDGMGSVGMRSASEMGFGWLARWDRISGDAGQCALVWKSRLSVGGGWVGVRQRARQRGLKGSERCSTTRLGDQMRQAAAGEHGEEVGSRERWRRGSRGSRDSRGTHPALTSLFGSGMPGVPPIETRTVYSPGSSPYQLIT